MAAMKRIFHVFDKLSPDAPTPVCMLENGVPKAMALIAPAWDDIATNEDALEFSNAVYEAFGKLPTQTEEEPWEE